MAMPGAVTIVGIILLMARFDSPDRLRFGEMGATGADFRADVDGTGCSLELTQAAYRVGDSTTNIITPLMLYFPLVVV